MTAAAVDLDELARLARAAGRIGLDTEFMSERRYQALLCLVQVVVPDPAGESGQRIAVVDPLAGEGPGPLAELVADEQTAVVVHAGRQDIALLRRAWSIDPRRIFDTQVAAGFAGLGAQTGYDALVRSVLGVGQKGQEGFTRWDRRPLTPEQLAYARADVAHLLPLAAALEERLSASGRLEWAWEECRALEAARDDRRPGDLFARLPRVRRLGGAQQALALALLEWREERARAADRPAPSFLPDHVLVELARRRPDSRRAVEETRGLPAQTAQKWWKELVAVVEAHDPERRPPPLPAAEPGEPADAPLIALGQALVRQRALEAGVAPDLISTQADVAAVVAAVRRGAREARVRTLEGWRRELVGSELLELLAGRRIVRIDRGRLAVEPD